MQNLIYNSYIVEQDFYLKELYYVYCYFYAVN